MVEINKAKTGKTNCNTLTRKNTSKIQNCYYIQNRCLRDSTITRAVVETDSSETKTETETKKGRSNLGLEFGFETETGKVRDQN